MTTVSHVVAAIPAQISRLNVRFNTLNIISQ